MRRVTSGGIAAAIVSLCLVLPGVAAADPRASYSAADASPAEVRAYWTQERMENAIPLDIGLPTPEAVPEPATMRDYANAAGKPYRVAATGPEAGYATPVTDTAAPGTRTHGKIFASNPSSDYVCSGTVVTGPNQSTVWTAAHCIYDTQTGEFANFLLFVPGYNQGLTPFGEWAARGVAVPQSWVDFGDQIDDVGAAVIQTKFRSKTPAEKRACNRFKKKRKRKRCKRKPVPVQVQDVVGSRGIAFNVEPTQQTFAAFGYPVVPQPRFDGEHMELCVSQLKQRDPNFGPPNPIGIECDMQGGSSGGGFVIPGAYVNGNVSYGYPNVDPNTVYSPYFDSFIADFYLAVRDD